MRLCSQSLIAYLTILICAPLAQPAIALASDDKDKKSQSEMDAARDIDMRGMIRRSRKNPSILNIYLQITNNGKNAYLIRGITSPSCATIFGVNFDQDDTEQTAELFSHFTLPSKVTLVFPRGGYHLVCRNFDPKAETNGALALNFNFLEGGNKTIKLRSEGEDPAANHYDNVSATATGGAASR